jgi:hypothetical protein
MRQAQQNKTVNPDDVVKAEKVLFELVKKAKTDLDDSTDAFIKEFK